MELSKDFKEQIFDQTEKPGQLFAKNVQKFIRARYDFASKYVKDKDVLEVGCGSGYGLQIFEKLSKTYSGIEYSEENYNFIKAKYIDSFNKISIGNAHQMNFKSKSKDVIIALAIIYYLNFEKFLSESSRILRKNGSLIFCTTNKNYPGFSKAPLTNKYYSTKELNLILQKYGFIGNFYGVFPNKNNLYISHLIGLSKNQFKKIFKIFKASNLWNYIKSKLKNEKKYRLPMDFFEMQTSPSDQKKINPDKIDREHLVIYCQAKYIGK